MFTTTSYVRCAEFSREPETGTVLELDKMAARCGGQTAPGIAPIFVEEYDDELSVMYIDLQHPPPGVAAQLDTVERALGLLNGAPAQEMPLFPTSPAAGLSLAG